MLKHFHVHSYDYLRIKNDNNQTIGTYCGYRSGHVVIVTGNVVKILFHSDSSVSRMGYNLSFSDVPLGKYNKHEILILVTFAHVTNRSILIERWTLVTRIDCDMKTVAH